MLDWLNSFIQTFVPLFIVLDAFGNLPFIITCCEGLTTRKMHRLVDKVILTAAVVGLIFLFFGQLILRLMDITVGSFAIGGGIILLVLSIRYMTTGTLIETAGEDMIAVVPLATPLVVGPATITTLLLLTTQYRVYIVLISFVLNLLVNWLIFQQSTRVMHFLGRGGIKAISRVFSLLMAAIAVAMVIRGLGMLGILTSTG